MRRSIPLLATVATICAVGIGLNPTAATATCTDCVLFQQTNTYICAPAGTGTTNRYACHTDSGTCYLEIRDCTDALTAADGSVYATASFGSTELAVTEEVVSLTDPDIGTVAEAVALRSPCNGAILARTVTAESGETARLTTRVLTL